MNHVKTRVSRQRTALSAASALTILLAGCGRGSPSTPQVAPDDGARAHARSTPASATHVAEMKTGPSNPLAELRSQTIKPYTDLLLHDMGAGLADNFTEGRASGNLWRTSPLWGLGYAERIMGAAGQVGYLHDGRARTVTEAVMWHDGEAARARQRFAALSATDRDALLAFLKSL